MEFFRDHEKKTIVATCGCGWRSFIWTRLKGVMNEARRHLQACAIGSTSTTEWPVPVTSNQGARAAGSRPRSPRQQKPGVRLGKSTLRAPANEMHGPITLGRVSYALGQFIDNKRGSRLEVLFLLQDLEYHLLATEEPQNVRTIR